MIDLFTVKELRRPIHKTFDVAGYTGMELSHGGDTFGLVHKVTNDGKKKINNEFLDLVQNEYADLKVKAGL